MPFYRLLTSLTLLLLTSCAPALTSPHPTIPLSTPPDLPTECVARRPSVRTVYVQEGVSEYIPNQTINFILDAWGFSRSGDAGSADAWVVIDETAHMPVTEIPLSMNRAIIVRLGRPTADRLAMFSHELCHVASRSKCHLPEGLCASTINSQTEPYPAERELELKLTRMLVK